MIMFSNAGINPVAVDIIFAIIMALLTIGVAVIGVWLLVKYIGKDKNAVPSGDKTFVKIFTLLIFGGIVFRLALSLLFKGYRGDYDVITEAMETVSASGFKNYYRSNGILLYPLTLLVYAFFGLIANSFGLASTSYAMGLFVKLPLIIADVVTAIILYRAASKYVNGYVALIVSGMFLLMPVFMISSAVWGSIYSLLCAAIVSSLYFMANRNYIGLFASYTASLLIMKEALYLFPLFAVFIIYNFVKALSKVIKDKIPVKSIWNNAEVCQVIRTPIYFAASVLAAYLISLPTFISSYGAGFLGWIYRFSFKPLADAAKFGFNSLGIFNIFTKNGDLLGSNFPTVVFAVIFGLIILGIVLLVYLSKKNRANLVFLAGFIIFTLATYYVDFTALTLIPVLAIFLLAFILIKDRRILHVFIVLCLLVFVNAASVLISAGYLNNASDYLFDSAFYTGTDLLDSGAGMVVSIICSVAAVITHLYSTLILLDLSMSNKRKLLPYNSSVSFGKSLIAFIKP